MSRNIAFGPLDALLLRIVAQQLTPIEFPALRDEVRRHDAGASACAIRKRLLALIAADMLAFGAGARGMGYTLGTVAAPIPLQAGAEGLSLSKRLLWTLQHAGREVGGSELRVLYGRIRHKHLLRALLWLYEQGWIDRKGHRGAYRFRYLGEAQRQARVEARATAEARRPRPVAPMVAAIAAPVAMMPSWPAPPAPGFGFACVGARRKAA